MKDFCVYGNPTVDLIKRPGDPELFVYGGGSYYSSLPLLERGLRVEVHAVYSPLLHAHPISRYIVKQQFSTKTNFFKIEYVDSKRIMSILEKAPPLYHWNVHNGLCHVVINPVLGEVSASLVKAIKHKALLLAVDLQGFLRETRGQVLVLGPSAEAIEVLRLADIVHADLEELQALTNRHNALEACENVVRYLRGAMLVTIRPHAAILVSEGRIRVHEFSDDYVAKERTGAGDYFLSTYTYYYVKTGDYEESLYKAHEYVTKWLKSRDARPHRAPTTPAGVRNSLTRYH